jgi:hypothetical protein
MASSSSNKLLQPALLGGLLLGALSALPVISIGNLCCCLWVISGGVLAAYLLQSNTPEPITTGDGAIVGLLAGVFGAVVQIIISIPVRLLMGPFQAAMMQRLLENPDMPPAFRTMMASTATVTVIGLIIHFFFALVVGAVFATIGGIIGAAIFAKKVPPPTYPEP